MTRLPRSVLLLHIVLLPLNVWRLRQLLQLTRKINNAVGGRLSLGWLKPFSRSRTFHAGELVFRRGDPATDVLFILNGRFRAVEADVVLGPGEVFGELGLVTKGNSRTQMVVCESDGVLLMIKYEEVRQMYYQNPEFGFFFLELVAERLMRDANQSKHRGPVAQSESDLPVGEDLQRQGDFQAAPLSRS